MEKSFQMKPVASVLQPRDTLGKSSRRGTMRSGDKRAGHVRGNLASRRGLRHGDPFMGTD
jgi:hypothetical protein